MLNPIWTPPPILAPCIIVLTILCYSSMLLLYTAFIKVLYIILDDFYPSRFRKRLARTLQVCRILFKLLEYPCVSYSLSVCLLFVYRSSCLPACVLILYKYQGCRYGGGQGERAPPNIKGGGGESISCPLHVC